MGLAAPAGSGRCPKELSPPRQRRDGESQHGHVHLSPTYRYASPMCVVPPLPVFFRLDAAGVITEYKYNEMQKACDGRRAGAGFLFPPKVRGKKRALEVTAQVEIAEEDQE